LVCAYRAGGFLVSTTTGTSRTTNSLDQGNTLNFNVCGQAYKSHVTALLFCNFSENKHTENLVLLPGYFFYCK